MFGLRSESTLTVAAIAALLVALTACSKKSGDFEGAITMDITHAGAPTAHMKFETAGGQVRIAVGDDAYTLVRPDGLAVIVLDSQKSYRDLDTKKANAAMAAADPNGAPQANKTGKHETIAGQDCEVWEVKHGDGSRTEACISEGLVGFDFGKLSGGGGPLAASSEVQQKKLFPLRSVELDASGKEKSRMTVNAITRQDIDKKRFEVPAGYTYMNAPK